MTQTTSSMFKIMLLGFAVGTASILWVNAAHAQTAPKIIEKYEQAAKSGKAPSTATQMAGCAAYWKRWGATLERDWEGKFISEMGAKLAPAKAKKNAAFWQMAAQKKWKKEHKGGLTGYDAAYAGLEKNADRDYEYLTRGNYDKMYNIFDILGSCDTK
ncbi:hypothetical protein LPB140_11880 [Sphingorhabdus lutea]|uniref:Lysozyme inhibitor LprI N-terminal domain-containing protein n=1 Tax=Sphingorhabdus lutea TaxID=1913578 RepID=A0A1L3JE17_9SPHN|nr:hypothetical protein [Sphingorhabdus lutea]APG63370.1 hypothetical protein LPB140_11880 [Sphingorhabdus lutea]